MNGTAYIPNVHKTLKNKFFGINRIRRKYNRGGDDALDKNTAPDYTIVYRVGNQSLTVESYFSNITSIRDVLTEHICKEYCSKVKVDNIIPQGYNTDGNMAVVTPEKEERL